MHYSYSNDHVLFSALIRVKILEAVEKGFFVLVVSELSQIWFSEFYSTE